MNEHLLKLEDCIDSAHAIAHLLAGQEGSDQVARSGLMIATEMQKANSALEAALAASRAEKEDKPSERPRATQPQISAARLTDAADETRDGIREIMSALDAATMSDLDAEGSRAALRGYAKLARMAFESAQKSAALAERAYEQTRPASEVQS